MELPIVAIPTYVEELSTEFTDLFDQERQFDHFKRLMTAFPMAEKCTIAHMNGLFTEHTNQSNLNRFITAPTWDLDQLNRKRFKIINEVEGDGTVIIDDFIVEKYGKDVKKFLLDETGHLDMMFRVLCNKDEWLHRDQLQRPLRDGDHVTIMMLVAGG